jgi:hypothetical protein
MALVSQTNMSKKIQSRAQQTAPFLNDLKFHDEKPLSKAKKAD